MHQRRFMIVVALLALTLTLLPTTPTRSAPLAAPLSSVFGINSHIASRYPIYESLATPADVVANIGVGWVREDFQFARIQPSRDKFDWGWHDRMIDLMSARGIQVIGLLNAPTPSWASGQPGNTFYPPDPQTFANFASAVVTRYRGRISYWQVWNEPDNAHYWQPQPNIPAYAELLKATYRAIKAADPNAQVLAASVVSPQPAGDFLRQLHAQGAWNSFDIISVHPYTEPAGPEEGQINVAGIGSIQGVAANYGSKPIWATEFGWSAGPSDRTGGRALIDAQTQANYLVRGSVLLQAAGAERIFWYNLKDSGSQTNLYGLVSYGNGLSDFGGNAQKPAILAYQVMLQQLAGTGQPSLIDLSTPVVMLDFEAASTWRRGGESDGTFTQTSEQVHSGQSSARLTYNFTRPQNDYVSFIPSSPINLPANTSKLGIWLYGDGSGHALKVLLRDSQGEVLQYRIAPLGSPGWQFVSTPLSGLVEPGNVITNGQNRRLDLPASLTAIIIDDDPDSTTGSGTIYIDNMTAMTGPETYAVRYPKGNSVVDVIWAPSVSQVVLPTQSNQIQRVRAWGETSNEASSNGRYTFSVGPDPVYIHHTPAALVQPTPNPVPPPAPGPDARCFPETGQCISGRIREYWEQNGGLPVFGYPTSPQRAERIEGKEYQVQWFERNRLELHPENARPYDVLLGRLGDDRLVQQGRNWQNFPKSNQQQGCRYFPETGHNVCGAILKAWRANGLELDGRRGKTESENLALFGLPLSDVQVEVIEGREYQVQWFERARFELHPENQAPYDVLLGLLGNEVLGR
ncbi:hypothetical protein OSCT_0917 [Oscillochloris trichoides DG-6]|uniref:Glycoside hydrolase family 5 domain-containing protein n=1 Tax=Oscillochloris trichoides DG-6 TaxID=765420 RepID=E1IC66_9CHLR|nr:beta-galactosidase [Oscillochloris trichoides]EFO81221.1 hypothetical protein OSCT_0917 [Oscillochloris trichoides DG-6]